MILVDIKVPGVEQTYDFSLDENAPIALVMEEIVEMIGQKEHCTIAGNKEELLLCSYERQAVLPKKATLRECGIATGSRLLLV